MGRLLTRRLVLALVLTPFLITYTGEALATGSGKSGNSSGTKTVHVKGYATKKGTYVPAHVRKAPTRHKDSGSTNAARSPEPVAHIADPQTPCNSRSVSVDAIYVGLYRAATQEQIDRLTASTEDLWIFRRAFV